MRKMKDEIARNPGHTRYKAILKQENIKMKILCTLHCTKPFAYDNPHGISSLQNTLYFSFISIFFQTLEYSISQMFHEDYSLLFEGIGTEPSLPVVFKVVSERSYDDWKVATNKIHQKQKHSNTCRANLRQMCFKKFVQNQITSGGTISTMTVKRTANHVSAKKQ